jgi:hypothetical protein
MANFRNFTGHNLNLPNGVVLPSEGQAKVQDVYGEFDGDGVCLVSYGEVTGLPAPQPGVFIVVSALVLGAAKGRTDLVAPATGHPLAKKNEKGHVLEVPGFVRRA